MEQLLTTDEAAAYLRLHPFTLRNWRTRGGGPRAVKVGRSVRYRLSDIEAWLEEHAEDRTPVPGGQS